MAAIDKIYGNKKQHEEFYNWCKENCPPALRWFYYTPDEVEKFPIDDEDEVVVANFPKEVDHFMLYNCDIDWVTERIWDQYGLSVGNLLEFWDTLDDIDKKLEKELNKYWTSERKFGE